MRVTEAGYRLSFTTGGLFRKESKLAARLFMEQGDWKSVRSALVNGEQLAFRTKSTADRVSREIIARTATLQDEDIALMASASHDVQTALAWIAACRRFEFIADFARVVINDHVFSRRMDLSPADFDRFVEGQSAFHPELDRVTSNTTKKLRQVLMRMLKEAGFLSKTGELIPYAFLFNTTSSSVAVQRTIRQLRHAASFTLPAAAPNDPLPWLHTLRTPSVSKTNS